MKKNTQNNMLYVIMTEEKTTTCDYRLIEGKLAKDGVEAPDLETIDSASLLSPPFICFCTRYAYRPFCRKSSRWLPCSTIWPWSITIILSAFSIVLNRCATTTTVCPFRFLWIACWTWQWKESIKIKDHNDNSDKI